jgi:hypothetical protein
VRLQGPAAPCELFTNADCQGPGLTKSQFALDKIPREFKFKKEDFNCNMKFYTLLSGCNSRYLGGQDWEDGGSRPVEENSSKDLIPK